MTTYQASLLICSGRPDPVWDIPSGLAAALAEHWLLLPLLPEAPPPPCGLGYRGCLLLSSAGEVWNAFDGTVALRKDGSSEVRYDEERIFEKMLIKSAPTGVLPPEGIML